jgi:hypothetical protein
MTTIDGQETIAIAANLSSMDEKLFTIVANLSTIGTSYNYTQLTLGAPASNYS